MTNENNNTELAEARKMTRIWRNKKVRIYYPSRYNKGLKELYDYYQTKFTEAITYERGLKKAIELINGND